MELVAIEYYAKINNRICSIKSQKNELFHQTLAVKDLPLVFPQRCLHKWCLWIEDAPATISTVCIWIAAWVCNVQDQCQKQRVKIEFTIAGGIFASHFTLHTGTMTGNEITTHQEWLHSYVCEAHLPNNASVDFWRPKDNGNCLCFHSKEDNNRKRVENAESTFLVYFASHLWPRSRKMKIHYYQTLTGYLRAIEMNKFDFHERIWMRLSELIGKDKKQVEREWYNSNTVRKLCNKCIYNLYKICGEMCEYARKLKDQINLLCNFLQYWYIVMLFLWMSLILEFSLQRNFHSIESSEL